MVPTATAAVQQDQGMACIFVPHMPNLNARWGGDFDTLGERLCRVKFLFQVPHGLY
jgi:hypothetical protein